MDDIPVDTPLGRTVKEIEAKAQQMALAPFSYVYECCETVLALCRALRVADQQIRNDAETHKALSEKHIEVGRLEERIAELERFLPMDTVQEVLRLEQRIAELEAEVARLRSNQRAGAESFSLLETKILGECLKDIRLGLEAAAYILGTHTFQNFIRALRPEDIAKKDSDGE